MNDEKLLDQVKVLLQSGENDKAAAMASERDTKSVMDAALHLQWAGVLEDLGLFDELIVELNLAVRDDPENTDTYRRLAEIYLDQGLPEKAGRCFAALIKREPSKREHYYELGRILEEAADYEKALELYKEGFERTGDETFNTLIRSLGFLSAEGTPKEPVEVGDQIIPSQHHLVTFTTLFAGREGVYARHWASPTGETGYTPVHEPFTLKVAENHILGNITIGVYPIRMDNTVNFIAFDLDLPKSLIAKAITSESQWKKAMAVVHSVACRVVDLGAAHDVTIYIEDSGFKGRHCWIFLETPVPAGVARRFGVVLLNQLEGTPQEVNVEVFPKQGTLKPGSLGNLIKLPLGFHKKTGKRGLLIQPDGQPYPSQLDFLEGLSKTSRRSVYALIQRFQKQVPARSEQSAPWEETGGQQAVPARLEKRTEEYSLDRDGQFQILIMRCPAIKSIIEKINREASVSRDETAVLIHTVGHLEQGPSAVNQLFQRCGNADPTLFLKSKLRGNPMSCPKIRARIPHITSSVACNCRFDGLVNLYPTPLIHVYISLFGGSAPTQGLTVDSLTFHNMLQEYLKLRKDALEIALLLSKYENHLCSYFEQAGIEAVQTVMGVLKQIKQDDGAITFALEMPQTSKPSASEEDTVARLPSQE